MEDAVPRTRGKPWALRRLLPCALAVAWATVVSAGDFDDPGVPAWSTAPALRRIELPWDPTLTEVANGDRLQTAVAALVPGDELVLGAGTWALQTTLDMRVSGRAEAPVRLVAAEPRTALLTAPPLKNVVQIGPFEEVGGRVSHLVLRGLVLEGGSIGLRIYAADDVWIDGCEIRHTHGAGLTANTRDNDGLWFTANRVHHTAGYGEGFYLGRDDGTAVMSRSVVARNHVHDTAGLQGDGIELKQGCWGNRIVGNRVHDTAGPCLTLYGTGGRAPNLVAGNAFARSQDHVVQVQGEARVVGNHIAGGRSGLFSADHRDRSRDLVVQRNVVRNPGGIALDLSGWRDRPGLVVDDNVLVGEVRWPDGRRP